MNKNQFVKWLNKKQYFHFVCEDNSIAIHFDKQNETAKKNLVEHIQSVTTYTWMDYSEDDYIVIML